MNLKNHVSQDAGCTASDVISPLTFVSSTFEMTHQLVHRLEALADTLVGATPESSAGKTHGGPGNGLLNDLAGQASETQTRISAGFAALDRIQRALP